MSKFIKIIAKTPKDNGFQNLLLRKREKSSTEICTSTGPSSLLFWLLSNVLILSKPFLTPEPLSVYQILCSDSSHMCLWDLRCKSKPCVCSTQ